MNNTPALFDMSKAKPIDSRSRPLFDMSKAKRIGTTPHSAPPPSRVISTGTIKPLTQRERFEMTYPVGVKGETPREDIYNTAQNVGVGIWKTVAHLPTTLIGAVESLIPGTDTPNPIKSLYDMANTGDVAGGAQAAGQAIAMAPIAEFAGTLADGLKETARRGAEAITKTGPRSTAAMVEETRAANAEAVEKNAIQVAEHDSARAEELRAHHEKTQAVQTANEAKQAMRDRKGALNRGVEHLDPEIQSELQSTEERVNTEANRKYKELSDALEDQNAPRDTLPNLLGSASEKIKGSNTEPTILKDMEKRLQRGDSLTYGDLQGYRAELGRELRKGTLPGDVFHAYKGMQEDITSAMEEIASRNKMLPQFRTARAYYRDYAETFLDRGSPVRKALDATERGQTVKAFGVKDQSGVEALARHNPELARRINTIRGYQSEAAAIRPSSTPPKALPKLPERTPAPELQVKTLSPEDLSESKRENVLKRAEAIRNSSNHLATIFVALDALRRLMHGDIEGMGIDVAARIGYAAGKTAFVNLLERPAVLDAVSRITPRDVQEVMKLPPDQRVGFEDLLKTAHAKGVHLLPGVIGAMGGVSDSSSERPFAGPRTQQLWAIRDQYAKR